MNKKQIDKATKLFILFSFIIFVLLVILFFISKDYEIGANAKKLKIESFFKNNSFIPKKYTCDGENVNPPLFIKGLDDLKNVKSLVVVVEDPDAPKGTFVHWIAWNIEPKPIIEEASSGKNEYLEGVNDFGVVGYKGPCPPKGDRVHHYYFYVYALDKKLNLKQGADIKELKNELYNHVIGKGVIVGLYKR